MYIKCVTLKLKRQFIIITMDSPTFSPVTCIASDSVFMITVEIHWYISFVLPAIQVQFSAYLLKLSTVDGRLGEFPTLWNYCFRISVQQYIYFTPIQVLVMCHKSQHLICIPVEISNSYSHDQSILCIPKNFILTVCLKKDNYNLTSNQNLTYSIYWKSNLCRPVCMYVYLL